MEIRKHRPTKNNKQEKNPLAFKCLRLKLGTKKSTDNILIKTKKE